ncbi:MAG TPA: hypothetical protein ENO29_02670 [Candidatus Aminicenantes bacterium]|nr:hypothetical protein [Candidatus Aminicenantes bacterium]
MAQEKVIEFREKKMKNNKLNIYFLVIILALIAILILDKRFLPGNSPSPQLTKTNADLIGTVMQLIKTDYLEEPNPLRTTEGAFRGLIDSLDPLSAYLNKDLAARYLKQKQPAETTGLILFKKYGIFPLVTAVLEGSPAFKAGLKVGDNISAINDKSTLNMSLLEVNLLLQSADSDSSQPIKLRAVRGTDTLEFQVRADFSPTREVTIFEEKPGFLRLKTFSIYPGLSQEIKKLLSTRLAQKKDNIKAIALDLRDCPDGDYEEAVKVINLFLKADEIGYFEKRGVKELLSCPDKPSFPTQRLIIWVNQATYGPAELIAGVLQDFKRAQTVGIDTPGLVGKQEPFSLPDGSLVVLTTEIFSLKSGVKLWDNSVPLSVKLSFSQDMDKAYLDRTKSLLASND